ncbi:MAG TPA: type I-E CRISPR-associated protein Cse1/CasA, partial [Smithella sp.]|nr:type I-E CRISPR-associated protein Cse1/CasA [Smithella sp.]
MAEFNLIDEEWIPCITLDGRSKEFGIQDTLLKAHELREICDDSPLVTVAIHRLLLAILYRAYSGPSDFSGWKGLYAKGKFNPNIVTVYLEEWKGKNRFYLLDDKYPFYQMSGLETNNAVSVNRLATECASGNNATLFDHSSDDAIASLSFAKVARQLLACQSFALGFGKSGNAKIYGKDETLPYSADAIALRGMTVWIQGPTLFETLMTNLTPSEDESLPPWELSDPHKHRDILSGKDRKAVGSLGTVDRFTWQSRLVRLIPNDMHVSKMYFTQGRSADKSAGDPMKAYRFSKEEGISAVPLSSNKAAWRDAHAILTIPPPDSNERRPECFNLLARASASGVISSDKPFFAQVVGLASAPNKAGKFLLWRHERLPAPPAFLGDENLSKRERLGRLLEYAEQAAIALNNRVRRIAKLYLSPDSESPDGQQPDKDEVTKVINAIDPRPAYWARLEKHFFDLLENLPGDWDGTASDWKPDNQQIATWTWRDAIKQEAKRALEESVRTLGTTAR